MEDTLFVKLMGTHLIVFGFLCVIGELFSHRDWVYKILLGLIGFFATSVFILILLRIWDVL